MVSFSSSRVAQAAALLCLFSSFVHAQSVVITGAREPLSVERLAADVVIIDADAIRASTADSVADLLRRTGIVKK